MTLQDIILGVALLEFNNVFRETTNKDNVREWYRLEEEFYQDHFNKSYYSLREYSVEAALHEGLLYLRCARYCRNRLI